jgi:hypothetical protein
MGGNGSYSKEIGGVPDMARTHVETNFRVGGHKVLLQDKNKMQAQMPMNSNSESPIYLIATINKKGELEIKSFGIYDKHVISKSVDLVFDSKGNLVPYNGTGKATHSHDWVEISPGIYGRKPHDKQNFHPIDSAYNSLLDSIVNFNKSKKKWTGN